MPNQTQIIDAAVDKWRSGRRTKMAPSGWLSGNAPCCEHRGQNPDKRGRGGMKFDGSNCNFHCFNCGFTANYTVGKPLYPKFIKLLEWLNTDEGTIRKLKFESLRLEKLAIPDNQVAKVRRNIKEVKMPDSSLLLDDSTHQSHVDFLKTRGFTVDDFPFLVSPEVVYRNRVILPFIMHDTIVGYSARSINPSDQYRYIMKMESDFVFGMDWIEPDHEWVFVTEGLFDALSVRCLAVMHNEISDAQTEMVCDLQKRIIVVPDMDKTGLSRAKNGLIQTALDCGWSVAFPEWKMKDMNAAYVEYGPLFVVKHLLDMTFSDPTKIRLKQKFLNMELKTKGLKK